MDYSKVILCSSTCSPEEYRRLLPDDKFKTGQSIQKYFRILCSGFVFNDVAISVYSKRPVNRRNTRSFYLPHKDEISDGVNYHYSSLLNIKLIGLFYSFMASFLWFMSKKNCTKNHLVIIDPLQVGASIGCLIACKMRGVKTLSYVTDVAKEYAKGNSLPSFFKTLSTWVQVNTSGMVFVTEQMNEIANPKQRPYVVIEGFVDERMEKQSIDLEDKYSKKVVMYTGGIERIYGLDMLIKGFLYANVPDSELHLYGSGSYVKEVINFSHTNDCIKYYGIKDNSEIIQEQMKATLLVNPRYTDGEYTKYSFPGKNLEYMVSGTPVLTTLLPGMPRDYIPYVYILKEENANTMASLLSGILSQSASELYAFGARAKEWMLSNKTSKMQVLKIIQFAENKL